MFKIVLLSGSFNLFLLTALAVEAGVGMDLNISRVCSKG